MTTTITTLDKLAPFAESKQVRQLMVEDILNLIDSGNADPLQVHYHVKALEDLIKQLTTSKQYKDAILNEAHKHGKSFSFQNSKMEVKETGSKYDYSVCNDAVWTELNKEIEKLTEARKYREEFLRSIRTHGLDILDEDGVVHTIYPPAKSSTTSLTVTLI
jgi:phenylalanine-4-hydroxylase